MNYYRQFPGDYARDTATLTWVQDCAYRRLLDHIYTTEKPIPSKTDAFLASKARTKGQRLAVGFVLATYFVLTPEGYTNKRFEEELNHAESRRQKADKAWKSRWHADAPSNASSIPEKYATPDSRLQTPDKDKNGCVGNRLKTGRQTRAEAARSVDERQARARANSNGDHERLQQEKFDLFWDMYPRESDPEGARDAWTQVPEGEMDRVIASLPEWTASPSWQQGTRWIPYARNFLQNKQWREPVPKENPNGKGQPNPDEITRHNLAVAQRALSRGSGGHH